MRIILSWLDQLRTTTVERLPEYCNALVSQLEEMAAAANAWAETDHNSEGTHAAVQLSEHSAAPSARASHLVLYFDGTDLKVVRPDGTSGTVTIT